VTEQPGDETPRPQPPPAAAQPTVAPPPAPTPTVEPPARPVAETPTEPTVEAPAAAPVESPAEPTVEPPVEPLVEPPVESLVEPPVEPLVEPTVEPPVEPLVEPTVEPPVEPLVEPPVEPLAEPVVEASPAPTAEPPASAPVDAPTEPAEATPANTAVEAPPAPTVEAPAEPTVEPLAAEPPAEPPTPATVAPTVHEHHPVPTPPASGPPGSPAAAWGRVGEDGTVYVRTAQGERSVGSYPGAAHDEALAYFGRKYDELEGQVALLEQRLAAGGVNPKDAATSVAHLREAVTDAHAVGDLDGLLARLAGLDGQVAERRKEADTARQAARQEALVLKERIVAEAETLRASSDWKRTGDRMRTLLDEWKAAARLDRKTDDALWKRFSQARTSFDKQRRAHFAELDTQRSVASERKEKLIAEAEELATSTDWGPTARRYRDLMSEWKEAGRARRDVEDELWNRFRAAQDTFFSARNETFSTRDADLKTNLEVKLALLVEAEALLPVTDPRATRNALRSVHDRWEAAGHVPRGDKDAVEGRLRKVDDAVRAAEDTQWKRSNPEARARAEATVGQLRTSIESFDAEAAKADAAGQADKATKAREAAAARREWLAEAERTLAEFS
jgi:hypothetical protein